MKLSNSDSECSTLEAVVNKTLEHYFKFFMDFLDRTMSTNFIKVLWTKINYVSVNSKPDHMTMVWDLANGAGIPAQSDAIDVCVSPPGKLQGNF